MRTSHAAAKDQVQPSAGRPHGHPAGYLFIPEKGGGGVRVSHTAGDEAGRAYWEGNFHWSDLISSQFLNAETQGLPSNRFKYVVTEAQVGKPLNWTISYREGGTTIDLFLFSTRPDLLDPYAQEELDSLLLARASGGNPKLTIALSRFQRPGRFAGGT